MNTTQTENRKEMVNKMFTTAKALCHAGTFHADDVFSGALLRLLNPEIEIIRSNSVPENFDGIVFDIGNGEFDHHSLPRETREDGTPYAAFGKLWRAFGHLLTTDFVVEYIDKTVCSKLDLTDNTGEYNMLSEVIGILNPFWTEDELSTDDAYFDAVELAQKILARYIAKGVSEEKARTEVEKHLENSSVKGMLILEKYVPWQYFVTSHTELNLKVVIYPSNRGGFCAQIVDNSGFEFPKSWWGTMTENDSPVNGMTFCHATGFLASFKTIEDAIREVQKVL